MEYMQIAQRMPKVELHCHFSGAVTAEDMAYLATHFPVQGAPMDVETLREKLTVTKDCTCLQDFLDKFTLAASYLTCPDALEWAACNLVRRAAADGVLYQEIRFSPRLLAGSHMPWEAAVEAVLAGLARGQREWGVPTNGILILGRAFPAEENVDLLRRAARVAGENLVAVDIAGPEGRFPPEVQAEPIALAKSMGYHITIHAGEEGPARNIETAVFQMGAERIGHGTFLWQQPGLLERLLERGVGVEMCPTSNYLTRAIERWEDYRIRSYFDAGLPIAVCSDDPAMSASPLTNEYALVMERFGFTVDDMERMVSDALQISFSSDKNSLRQQAKEHFTALRSSL